MTNEGSVIDWAYSPEDAAILAATEIICKCCVIITFYCKTYNIFSSHYCFQTGIV